VATVTADTTNIANGNQVDADDISTCINSLQAFINDGTADTNNYSTNKSDMCLTFVYDDALGGAKQLKTKLPASISNFTVVFATAYMELLGGTNFTVRVVKKSGGSTTTIIAAAALTCTVANTIYSTSSVTSGTLSGGDELHVVLTNSGTITGPITVTIWAQATHRVAE